MEGFVTEHLNSTAVWTWLVIFTRLTGLFSSLPGVGTEEIPLTMRGSMAMVIACALTWAGIAAPLAESTLHGCLLLGAEFFIGYAVGSVPAFIIQAVSIAGQVSAGAIGLAQGSMIDPSLGTQVTTVARFQSLVATCIFLSIGGHVEIMRLCCGGEGGIPFGMLSDISLSVDVATALFSQCFASALRIAAPVILTTLATNVVLGLITKFVSQINVFVMSLALTIGIGLLTLAHSLDSTSMIIRESFDSMDAQALALVRTEAIR